MAVILKPERSYKVDNNIYQISARIKNAAAINDHAFSPQGVALCNMFTHVVKELYDFADTLEDQEVASKLRRVIQKQETFPARLLDLFKPVEEITDESESCDDETQSYSQED